MDRTLSIYIVFGIALLVALALDLGIISKKQSHITVKKALLQTMLWVGLSLAFWAFIWVEKGSTVATKYISAYLMEWSLSIDNVFVFILIFSFFKIHEGDTARVLLIGVLLAIFLRIIFIAIGIGIINQFHWILYIFGVFLLYTGFKLFFQKQGDEYQPQESAIYKVITKFVRITDIYRPGRYMIKTDNKLFFTTLSLVVLMLAGTDILFALDSIPTVVALVRESGEVPFTPDDILVIYSSNIFAVLGLRSLFFVLRGAANQFEYLQQGIAAVLIFIGAKMLIDYFVHISIYISLAVIVVCITSSIIYSKIKSKSEAT